MEDQDLLLAFARVGMQNAPRVSSPARIKTAPAQQRSHQPVRSLVLESPPTSLSKRSQESKHKVGSSRSLSSKRQKRFGLQTPLLDLGVVEQSHGSRRPHTMEYTTREPATEREEEVRDKDIHAESSLWSTHSSFKDNNNEDGRRERGEGEYVSEKLRSLSPDTQSLLESESNSSRYSEETKNDSKTTRRRKRMEDASYELSRSGTLHMGGFTVKGDGLKISPGRNSSVRKPNRNSKNNQKSSLLVLAASNRSAQGSIREFSRSQAGGGKEGEEVDEGYEEDEVRAEDVLAEREQERARGFVFSERELVYIRRLGKGASGVVQLARHLPSQKLVAVKKVPVFDDAKRAQMVAELKMLQQNVLPLMDTWGGEDRADPCRKGQRRRCQYIVGMYDCFVSRQDSTINLVLEWMDGGSVQDLIDEQGRLEEEEVMNILRCSLRGLEFLHGSRQLHRDIKPSNLLRCKRTGLVKLSDFGISHSFGSYSAASTFVGSLSYMAPERISGTEYSYPADLWSLGLCAYVCACGKYPYQKEYDEQGYWGLVHAISEEPSPTLNPHTHSKILCSFVNFSLSKNPSERPTAKQLLEFLLENDS